MNTVRRYDAATSLPSSRAKRLDNGWLRAPVFITRVGVFTYYTGDGKVRRELRLPEEVFNADSLDSCKLVPVTDNHPSPSECPNGLTAENSEKFQVGQVGDNIVPDGDKVSGMLMVTRADAVSKVESGKVQVSAGYFCSCDETPGVHPRFGRYDAIQRNIRYNHVALVDYGRAGPDVRVRLDSADAIEVVIPEFGFEIVG